PLAGYAHFEETLPSNRSPSSFSLRSSSHTLRAEILSAPLNGTVGTWTGQVGASGQVCLAVYDFPLQMMRLSFRHFHSPVRTLTESVRSNGDYNIFYSVLASSPTAGEPTFAGIAKDVGQERIVAVFFSPPGTDGPWVDLTTTSSLPQSRKSLGDASASPTTYTYALNGTWLQASTLTTFQGDTYKQLVDSIVAGPEGYCTGFGTTAVTGGAAMGQFQIQPVAVKA
ncbi:unnamed protein product, partial [Closterium sp. Yama58-4]